MAKKAKSFKELKPDKVEKPTPKNKKKISPKESIENLLVQLDIAKREGDKIQTMLIEKIIKRVESLELQEE